MRPIPPDISLHTLHSVIAALDAEPAEKERYNQNALLPGKGGRVPRRPNFDPAAAVRDVPPPSLPRVRVRFTHAAGGGGESDGVLRNLGLEGAAVVANGMLHQGTPVTLTLTSLENRAVEVSGKVRACRHVVARLHDIDIHFDAPLALGDFIEGEVNRRLREALPVEVPALRGAVLLRTDMALQTELLRTLLAGSSVRTTAALTDGEALDAIQKEDFDVLMLSWLNEDAAASLLGRIRAAGFDGGVIVMPGPVTDAARRELEGSLAVIVMVQPFTRSELTSALSRALETAGGKSSYSLDCTLADDPEARKVAGAFLALVTDMANQFAARCQRNEADILLAECSSISLNAASFGFPGLGDHARAVHAQIRDKGPADATKHLRRLKLYVARLAARFAEHEPTLRKEATSAAT